VGISGDNPHQTSNSHSLLKIYLVLEYWASLIPANPHFSLNFSVFLSIPNILPLPSGLWMGFYGDWVKVEISPNTLGDYPTNLTKTLVPNKTLGDWIKETVTTTLGILTHNPTLGCVNLAVVSIVLH
jgi:hypothetical protein